MFEWFSTGLHYWKQITCMRIIMIHVFNGAIGRKSLSINQRNESNNLLKEYVTSMNIFVHMNLMILHIPFNKFLEN